jgi:DNA-binding PadR family transcriptional regulator
MNGPAPQMSHHLGEFEQLLLFALLRLGDEASGTAVMDEIEQRTGRAVSVGAIYTGFERLTGKGLVTSTFGPPSPRRGGKRRRLYTLEPAGADALARAWAAIDRMAEGMAAKLRVFGG